MVILTSAQIMAMNSSVIIAGSTLTAYTLLLGTYALTFAIMFGILKGLEKVCTP